MKILVVSNDYYHLDRMVNALVRHGDEVSCRGSCMDPRGLSEGTLVQGVRRSSPKEATDWTAWADKVVAF